MSTELFIDIFTSLSQKRRHGWLKVVAPSASFEVGFSDGRIVAVQRRDARSSQAIVKKLFVAGALKKKVFDLVADTKVAVPQLYEGLVGKNYVAPDHFVRAKLAHELDMLHSLRGCDDAVCDFFPTQIKPDPRFPLSVAAGQILLDMAELDMDAEQLTDVLGDPLSCERWVVRSETPNKRLVNADLQVWEALARPLRVCDLWEGYLGSHHELMVGMLSLLESAAVTLHDAQPAAAEFGPTANDITDLASILAGAMEDELKPEAEAHQDVFARMAYDAVDSLLDGFEGAFQAVDDLLIPESGLSQPASDIPPAPTTAVSRAALPAVGGAPAALNGMSVVATTPEPPLEPAALDSEEEDDDDEQLQPSVAERLVGSSIALFAPEHRTDVVTAIACVFLLLLAWTLPAQIEQWFEAVGNFTSAG